MFKEIVLQEAQRRVHFARRLKDLFSSDLSELSAALDEEERAAASHLLELRSTTSLALTRISGEVVVKVCSYFDEYDLVNLGLTCKQFGQAQAGAMSLVEESARQIFNRVTTDDKRTGLRAALPRREGESNLTLLHHLCQMLHPLWFGQIFGDGDITCNTIASTLTDDHAEQTRFAVNGGVTAIANDHVMRAGKHFTLFSVLHNTGDHPQVNVGVVRPIQFDDPGNMNDFSPLYIRNYNPLDQCTARWGTSEIHCCSLFFNSGRCYSTDWTVPMAEGCNWEGMSNWDDNFVRKDVGLLLDLVQGTLTAYDGNMKLGVIKEGLGGEYSWFAHVEERRCTVSIHRLYLPSY